MSLVPGLAWEGKSHGYSGSWPIAFLFPGGPKVITGDNFCSPGFLIREEKIDKLNYTKLDIFLFFYALYVYLFII
jgi:hypothetical protein